MTPQVLVGCPICSQAFAPLLTPLTPYRRCPGCGTFLTAADAVEAHPLPAFSDPLRLDKLPAVEQLHKDAAALEAVVTSALADASATDAPPADTTPPGA